MAANPNTPGANPADPRPASASGKMDGMPSPLPPSKPLQIFLLIALVITGVAYVVDEYTGFQTEDSHVKRPSKLRRLVEAQSKYISETDLAHQAEAKNEIEDAIMHYRRALTGEDTAECRLGLGKALLKAGNRSMAFSQFKEASHINPALADIYLVWGQALVQEGKIDDAVQLYQDALRQNPKLGPVHYAYAQALQQQQQAAEAARHEEESTSQNQAAARSQAEAQLYALDAVKQYEAAAQLGLNTRDFWRDYGTLLNKQGNYPAAEECLIRATTLDPASGPAQFELALAETHLGKYADAIGHYEATLAATPDDPLTLNNLALLYATATNADVRSSKMAVQLATRACDATASQNARYLDTLARAYAADGDFIQAIASEDKAVRRATQLGDHELLRELQPRFSLFVQHKSE